MGGRKPLTSRLSPLTPVPCWLGAPGSGALAGVACVSARLRACASLKFIARELSVRHAHMTKSVGARVNEKIYDWMEEKADEEATTKARILEDLLVEEYKKDKRESQEGEQEGGQEGEQEGGQGADELRIDEEEQIVEKDSCIVLKTGDRDVATTLRRDPRVEPYLSENDDARMCEVRLVKATPESVLRDTWGRVLASRE